MNGLSLSLFIFLLCFEGGLLSLLIWLRSKEIGCDWDGSGVCHEAALHNHRHVIEWARANGAAWDESTCGGASSGGHLSLLQWLREEGCPWNATGVCNSAAYTGHLDVLKWAVERGGVIDSTT